MPQRPVELWQLAERFSFAQQLASALPADRLIIGALKGGWLTGLEIARLRR